MYVKDSNGTFQNHFNDMLDNESIEKYMLINMKNTVFINREFTSNKFL